MEKKDQNIADFLLNEDQLQDMKLAQFDALDII